MPNLDTIMKGKHVVRPPGSLENAMRATALALDTPTDAEQCG